MSNLNIQEWASARLHPLPTPMLSEWIHWHRTLDQRLRRSVRAGTANELRAIETYKQQKKLTNLLVSVQQQC